MKLPGGTAIRRLALVLVLFLGFLAGCSTGGTDSETDREADRAPSVTPTSDADGSESLRVENAQGENGAVPPWWNGSRLQAEIPQGVPPADKYRSEVFWARASGAEVRLGEGDRFSCRFTVTPHLGSAADDRDQWQVLWQLHGPNRDGQWHPPPLNLHVRGATWRIGGGAGRRDGERESYARPFPEFVDGHEATWRIDVVVSEDPEVAQVDAWLDGRQVVTDWHPPAATRYPDHEFLTLKSGLYAGSTGGAEVPRIRRWTHQERPRCIFTTESSPSASASP